MKITRIVVCECVGGQRDAMAVFEIPHPYLGKAEGTGRYRHAFTTIETDEGLSGLAYGGRRATRELGQLLLGEDPLRIEYLWEKLYGSTYYRLQHHQDIATLDLALWDLAGKARGAPVYSLLGGPVAERVPAYAALLGFSVEPGRAAERSVEWVAKGFQALKWYLPHNATAGLEGLKANLALVEAVRRAVGEEVGLILDFGISDPSRNSLLYMTELARLLEPYRIRWIEEPLPYDDLEAHRRLAATTRIPIALGERWYTRWQMRQLIEAGCVSVLQPDVRAACGLTEVRKIAALASVHGVPLVPHANESCLPTAHLLFASPASVCPMAEWGVKINHNAQYFFKEFYEPLDGWFRLPHGPGFGYEIDEEKVEERLEL